MLLVQIAVPSRTDVPEYQKLRSMVHLHMCVNKLTHTPQVLLVQIAVPSRTDVPEYQKLRSMVHEIVGRINGQYGTLTYVPIYHLDTSLSFTELCALYAVTDVAMVTSLRDGMNLVGAGGLGFRWVNPHAPSVAARQDEPGVVVVAGAVPHAGVCVTEQAGVLLTTG